MYEYFKMQKVYLPF